MSWLRWVLSAALLLLAMSAPLWAGEPSSGLPTVAVPTLGGTQFWGDERFFHQWRIQRNVLTGHYRLLDENDSRHAWGSYDQCLARLEQIKRERRLPPMRGRAVILLHGLGRSHAAMDKLGKHLRQQGGLAVFNVTYPSTQADIASHARALRNIIEHLDGIEEINFVAHSLGNIVVRRYLGDQGDAAAGRRPDRRIKRFVMLAPPNHGSLAALTLADNGAFQAVAGQSGQQLGRDWDKVEGKLATPAFPFGIIAGGKGDSKGYNPLLPGDNDGVISVTTARLAGAADFVVVRALHTFMMDDPKVVEYTLRFLQKGYFVSAEQRQPIANEE
jgi:hypothetical protein